MLVGGPAADSDGGDNGSGSEEGERGEQEQEEEGGEGEAAELAGGGRPPLLGSSVHSGSHGSGSGSGSGSGLAAATNGGGGRSGSGTGSRSRSRPLEPPSASSSTVAAGGGPASSSSSSSASQSGPRAGPAWAAVGAGRWHGTSCPFAAAPGVLHGRGAAVLAAQFSPGGGLNAATGAADGSVAIWTAGGAAGGGGGGGGGGAGGGQVVAAAVAREARLSCGAAVTCVAWDARADKVRGAAADVACVWAAGMRLSIGLTSPPLPPELHFSVPMLAPPREFSFVWYSSGWCLQFPRPSPLPSPPPLPPPHAGDVGGHGRARHTCLARRHAPCQRRAPPRPRRSLGLRPGLQPQGPRVRGGGRQRPAPHPPATAVAARRRGARSGCSRRGGVRGGGCSRGGRGAGRRRCRRPARRRRYSRWCRYCRCWCGRCYSRWCERAAVAVEHARLQTRQQLQRAAGACVGRWWCWRCVPVCVPEHTLGIGLPHTPPPHFSCGVKGVSLRHTHPGSSFPSCFLDRSPSNTRLTNTPPPLHSY